MIVLRRPESIIGNPQFWAEDGAVYTHDQLVYGSHAVFRPYYGYLQLLPRIVAVLASPFPVAWWPAIFNTAGLIIAAACISTFSLPGYKHLLESDRLRMACCLVSLAVSATPEIFTGMVNIQWFLLPAGVLFLFYQGRPAIPGPGWVIGYALAGLLISLTCPVFLVAAPLCVWRCWKNGLRSSIYEAVLVGGVIIQVCLFLSQPPAPAAAESSVSVATDLLRAVIFSSLLRVFAENLLGQFIAQELSRRLWATPVMVALAFIAAWLAWLFWMQTSRQRIRLVVALYLWLGVLLICLGGREAVIYFRYLGHFQFVYARYFFFPSAVLVFLIARTVAAIDRRPRSNFAALALVLIFSLGLLQNYRLSELADFDWKNHAKEVEAWREARAIGAAHPSVEVPINPPLWYLQLP